MPLYSDHITNMYYSGSPSYSASPSYSGSSYSASPYSSYSAPFGSSYSASYMNPGGNFSKHSSLASYSRPPLNSRWTPSSSRSYSPLLSTISERGTSSPVRITSPRRIPISNRTYVTPYAPRQIININTADIDVSRNKYLTKRTKTPEPEPAVEAASAAQDDSPFMPRIDGKPETGIDSSPGIKKAHGSTIKRGRSVVRLLTIKRKDRDSPRKASTEDATAAQTSEDSPPDETADVESSVGWREKLSDDLVYKDKREKKTLGAKLVEKFLVKDKDEDAEKNDSLSKRKYDLQEPTPAKDNYDNSSNILPPDRKYSMELLAEQATVLDSLIRGENLSTATLDLSQVGIEKENSNTPQVERRENPLQSAKSDHSIHDRLTSSRSSRENNFPKRRSLKKSASGGSLRRLDSITEFPKETSLNSGLPAIEENRQSEKSETKRPKLKRMPKITSSVEISPPKSPLKFKIEDVTVEEIPSTPKKEIQYSSVIDEVETSPSLVNQDSILRASKSRVSTKRKTKNKSRIDDGPSPEPDSGDFWDKIGKRETIYLMKRKQNIKENLEKSRRAMFWYPQGEDSDPGIEADDRITKKFHDCSDVKMIDTRATNNVEEAKQSLVKEDQDTKCIEIAPDTTVLETQNEEQKSAGQKKSDIIYANKESVERVKKDPQQSKQQLCLIKTILSPTALHATTSNSDIKTKPGLYSAEISIAEDSCKDSEDSSKDSKQPDKIKAKSEPEVESETLNITNTVTTGLIENQVKCLKKVDHLNIKENEENKLPKSSNIVNPGTIIKSIGTALTEANVYLPAQDQPNEVNKVINESNEKKVEITDKDKPACVSKSKTDIDVPVSSNKLNSEVKDSKPELSNKPANANSLKQTKPTDVSTKPKSLKKSDPKMSPEKNDKKKVTSISPKKVKGEPKKVEVNSKKDSSLKKTNDRVNEKQSESSSDKKVTPKKTTQIEGVNAKNNAVIDTDKPSPKQTILTEPSQNNSDVTKPLNNNDLPGCSTACPVKSVSKPADIKILRLDVPETPDTSVETKENIPITSTETKTEHAQNKEIKSHGQIRAEERQEKYGLKVPVSPNKPAKQEAALRPLIATPRPLQKKTPQVIHSSTETESSSEDETSSEEESESSDGSGEFFECENNPDGRTSTGSNDSGFDSSAPTSPAGFVHIKKGGDGSAGTSAQAQPSHAADVKEQDFEASTVYSMFRKTGRITPPAKSIPRFRKYLIDDFHFIKVLGKGSFGKVLLAELRDTEYYYAVKCLKKDVVLEDDDVESTLIERKVLALGTNHPYLCHLFATFQTDSHLFFVMEYLNGGDLMFHIQQSGRFTEARSRFYAAEIVSGLKFLHKRGIVYRDLKLDNILLDHEGHVRIADFGMCKLQIFLDKTADTFCGTPDYMAPEIIKGLKYNQTVDWWSFGVLLYEMLIGQSPFSGCDEDELFWSICNEVPSYPRFLSAESLTILTRLLDKDARTRLGGAECVHGDVRDQDFFRTVHWDRLERKELETPFRPRVRHPLDTQYFDRAFTGERPRLTAVEPQVLRSMDQAPFRGFSYTNPNITDR